MNDVRAAVRLYHPVRRTHLKTILIIEDEATFTEVLTMALEDEGYRILRARNGREGLEYLAKGPVDLILCDLMLPMMDGQEVFHAVRSQPAYSKIPFIMMTAAQHTPAESDSRYDLFLAKPFDLDHLLQVVGELSGAENSVGPE